MKKALGISIFIILALAAACLVYVPYDEQGGSRPGTGYDEDYPGRAASMDVSYFYDSLSPYGDWIDYPSAGYVWVPRHVGYGWRPYTHGRWIWTSYGWTWVSSYEWGWAPFHYGRWGHDRYLGWYWVPDTVWGPAWVSWRYGDSYCGWAPLPPGAEFSIQYGMRSGPFDIPDYGWVFIDGRYFLDDRLDRWVLPYERNFAIFDYTSFHAGIRVRGGHAYNEGVDIDRIRRITRRDVSVHELRDPGRPGFSRIESRDVVLHRPSLGPNQMARPKKFIPKDERVRELETGEVEEAPDVDETTIRNEHDREMKLLEESHRIEVGSIRRKTDEEKAKARNTQEKEKIENEYKARVSEIKKKQDSEKTKLTERQKQESEKVKKGRIRKKD